MVFINKGKGAYEAFAPQGLHIISDLGPQAESVENDKMYNLSPERELSTVSNITDYQNWVESDWKKPHGTYESVERFNDKLSEEIAELRDADTVFTKNGSDRYSDDALELLSELGDVLWCATALASNSSADIDKGLKECLYAYTMGISCYVDGENTEPEWHAISAKMSTDRKNTALSDIDTLISGGFEPLITTAMNLFDDGPELGIYEHIELIKYDSVVIKGMSDRQYNYGEDEGLIVMSELYDSLSADIGRMIAEVYLNIAYIAKHRLNATLEDVIAKNMNKINARVESKLVDKSDGERPTELL